MDRDEVLLHEMIRASGDMAGVFSPRKLGRLYDTEEEIFVVLMRSRISRTDCGRSRRHSIQFGAASNFDVKPVEEILENPRFF